MELFSRPCFPVLILIIPMLINLLETVEMTRWKILISITLFIFVGNLSFGELLFENGINNLIDYNAGQVRVTSLEGIPTGISVVEGGVVGIAVLKQNCYASVLGGTVSLIIGLDNISISISGGDVLFGISAGSSQSKVDISGGNIFGDVSIGTREFLGSGISSLDISGGYLERVSINETGVANISDGTIDEIITLGETIITGGHISAILNGGTGKVFLHGSDFLLDGLEIGPNIIADDFSFIINGEPQFKRLTGTLANGNSLNVDIFLGGNSQLLLIPEPTSVALLVSGVMALRRKRR